MNSHNSVNAANEVIKRVESGEKVVMSEILGSLGYAETVMNNPQEVTKGKAYQETLNPFVQQIETARQSAIAKLESTIDKAQYHQLVDGIDKFSKLIELLTGGDTDRSTVTVQISGTIAHKYGIDGTDTGTK